jgi:hypothetical protein
MNTSESISKIAPALLKAQKAITFAIKDAKNPQFKSTYADLSSVIDATKPALNDAGICFIQMPAPSDQGCLALTTRLIHESGEWIESTATCPLQKHDPQGYGSALTYLKRYSLASAVGLYQDDDDGNAASKPKQAAVRHKPTDGAVVDQHRLSIVADTADAAKERFAGDDLLGAFELCQGITDPEEKTALWAMLPSNLRSALKKHADSIKEQA